MLPEAEAVNHVDEAVVAFIVFLEWCPQLLQKSDLDICIINIKLFVFRYFGCYYFLIMIFEVNTFDHRAEGTFVDGPYYFIPVANLFTLFYQILPLLISYRILILSPYLANCVNAFKHAHFYLFKLCQFLRKQLKGLLGAVSWLLVLLAHELGVEWWQTHCSTLRAWSVGHGARGVAHVVADVGLVCYCQSCSEGITLHHGPELIWLMVLVWMILFHL